MTAPRRESKGCAAILRRGFQRRTTAAICRAVLRPTEALLDADAVPPRPAGRRLQLSRKAERRDEAD